MDQLIKEYTVFVVSKSSCPFCHTAKKVLNNYDIPPEKYKVIEIDGDRDCGAIQDYMHQLTGARTVSASFCYFLTISNLNAAFIFRSQEFSSMETALEEAMKLRACTNLASWKESFAKLGPSFECVAFIQVSKSMSLLYPSIVPFRIACSDFVSSCIMLPVLKTLLIAVLSV